VIYLDNHATTPVDPRVHAAMEPFLTNAFGNSASRTHRMGWEAREAIEKARAHVARLVHGTPESVVFTSGATESNNLAIKGAVWGSKRVRPHVITSAIEHPAVLDTVHYLEDSGQARATIVGVEKDGRVDPEEIRKAMRMDTILVSIMAANNETGVINPIEEIAALAAERDILFHTDATQFIGKLPADLPNIGVSMASISGHKMYGPKGVGALFVANEDVESRLVPLFHGGGHEGGLRSGTPAVPLLVGLGAAAEEAAKDMPTEVPRVYGLRKGMWGRIQEMVPDAGLNGNAVLRLPGNLNICFRGVEAENLIMDLEDVALSTGSACGSDRIEPSHVLTAMGMSPEDCHASVRIGIGRFNTQKEIDAVCEMLGRAVMRQKGKS
jgi:cysteine desulfurase